MMSSCTRTTTLALVFLTLAGWTETAAAQFTATSYAQLKALSGINNATVTMAPGEYWIDGNLNGATFLEFSGSNTVFDLTAAQFKLDTRDLAGYGSVLDVMTISGSDLTISGLNLSGHDVDLDTDPDARRYSNRSANYLRISGDNIALNDAHIITAGSNPYGYGDAFGKGAPPSCRDLPPGGGGCAFIGHNKTSGVLLNEWGDGVTIDGLDLDMFTFGHGVYVQGFDNVEIRNSSVTGQMFSSNDVINHPAYQQYGVNAYNQIMFPDILISGSEDGIRYYGDGNNLDWSENLIIENVTVTNMREAFSLIAARGTVTVNNASAYGSETGFEPGLGTVITNSRADVTNGPLLYYRRNYVDNTNVEIELVGDVPQVGRTWDIAYINGENNVVSLTSDIDPNLLSDQAYVRVGQRFNDWRHNLGDLDDTNLPADGVVVHNHTGQITVLGANGDNVTGFSAAGTINGGDGNQYDGLTLVLSGSRMIAKDGQALGNNGTATDGSLEANASVVFDGGTLELNPGVQINNEMLTITGNGVDGAGALYSDGTTSSGTRFGSSSGSNESTIFLDGNASIGVGIAGNQLLVGQIQGVGDLTKLGPGKLSIEKSSTLDGNLFVAEGEVIARPGVVHRGLTVAAGASIGGIGGNSFNTLESVLVNGTLDLNARTDSVTLSGMIGPLAGTGLIEARNTAAVGANELTVDTASQDAVFSGQIQDNVNLVKSGAGSQTLNGSLTYAGTTTVAEGTLLINGTHAGGDAYTVESTGTLGGNGSIDADIAVLAGGTLAPGASAGQLTVDQIVFATGSILEIEIGGLLANSQYDQLLADSITLAGDLAVSLIDLGAGAFLPAPADTFLVVQGTDLTGSFFNVASGERLDTTGGEGTFLVSYDSFSDAVMLSDFVPTTSPGDFDADGDVDGRDFLFWQSGGHSAGGLADWQAYYGNAGSLASAAAIPEPTSIAICMAALALIVAGNFRTPCRRLAFRCEN